MATDSQRPAYIARINRVVDHIDAHLAEPLDLVALATPPQAALTIALDVGFGSPSAAQRKDHQAVIEALRHDAQPWQRRHDDDGEHRLNIGLRTLPDLRVA